MVCPVFCVDPCTDAFMHGFPNLRKLAFEVARESDIEYARALIARAVRPKLMLDIKAFAIWDDNMDIWHPFDTVLFALRFCHKLQVRMSELENRYHALPDYFPLMSLFDLD